MKFNYVSPKLKVAKSNLGNGQFATMDIAQGELLAVFGGCVMTLAEFNELPSELQHYPYQICANPDLLLGPMMDEHVTDGYFFNHSCNPNSGFRGQQQLVAMRAVAREEEVTFDYATCMTGTFGNMQCSCGERDCRKFITGDDFKIQALQKKYDGYWMPYIKEKILAQRSQQRSAEN